MKEDKSKEDGRRANMFLEVYCGYDGEELDVAQIEMSGHRLKIRVGACTKCTKRNRYQGVQVAVEEIKKAAEKPLKVMEEMQS